MNLEDIMLSKISQLQMLYESTLYEESKVVKFIGIENGMELASG